MSRGDQSKGRGEEGGLVKEGGGRQGEGGKGREEKEGKERLGGGEEDIYEADLEFARRLQDEEN